MAQTVPTHDFTLAEENFFFEIFFYTPLTVMTPVLEANFAPHRHKFYELLYLTGGQGEHIVDFKNYELSPPVLYFLSPEQIHFWNLSEKLKGYVFLFNEDFLVSSLIDRGNMEIDFFQDMMECPSFSLNPEQQTTLEPLIQAMVAEYNGKEESQQSVLQAYFHIFLVTIQRICGEPQENPEQSSLLRQFKKCIGTDINCNIDVKKYAAKLGVSVSHLRNTIREQTGKSPNQLIRHAVIMEAKRLLIHTDLSAAEISYSLGFEDPSYFGRYFKREAGVSPRGFKSQISKKYHLKVT